MNLDVEMLDYNLSTRIWKLDKIIFYFSYRNHTENFSEENAIKEHAEIGKRT
jgi:hypothetical protein